MLYAEDSDEQRATIVDLLRRYEVDITEARSAEEEIQYARKGGYALILTDNRMPNRDDGIRAIQAIREFDKETPIILYTTDTDIAEYALQIGATEFLRKPTNIEEFYRVMDVYLK